MPDVRPLLRAARGRSLAAVAIGVTLAAGGYALWNAESRRSALRGEVRWLRARLAEKREQIAVQRAEMAEVAGAVERLARTAASVRDRAVQARRLAHMEESRESPMDATTVKATLDGGASLVSEDAARSLQMLAWLEGQATVAGDSIAVLTALLKDPPASGGGGMPSFWPVRGLVTSPFGPRSSPYGGGREVHPGIDIQAHYGMPVVAAGDGEVVFAARESGYGGLVIVAHPGGVDTFYAHLSAMYVREGQKVRRGQPLGAVGATGRATGAHLHYEVRVNGVPVDPNRYLVN
jgi:murein DD-endopeptidase MepM/ murein hydrolase activator NlpD